MAQEVTETSILSRKKRIVKKGIVYTFLQKEFKDYVPRTEDDNEADNTCIKTCFEELGFKVEDPLINGTKKEIDKYFEDKVCKSEILDQYECVFVFFVTHSPKPGELLCRQEENFDGVISDEYIVGLMKGEEYSNRPKIFIFQASQATRLQEMKGIQTDGSGADVIIPDEANFVFIKSSFEHKSSESEKGSFFLKVFCDNMVKIGNDDSLFDVMNAVLRKLKSNRSEDGLPPRNNRLPEITSTLLEPMFFNSERKTSYISSSYDVKPFAGKLIYFSYSRSGAEESIDAITKSFENIGFKVEVYRDLIADHVRDILQYGNVLCRTSDCRRTAQCLLHHEGDASADYSDYSCVAISIMGTGESNSLQTPREEMNIADIISKLIMKEKENEEREDLSGKPKLFFLDVCRGFNDHPFNPVTTPLEFDDTVIFHGCYQGKLTYREDYGSWFIQQLCKSIGEIDSGESVSLIEVLQKVQKTLVNNHENNREKRQMPVFYSTLCNNLIIKKLPKKLNELPVI